MVIDCTSNDKIKSSIIELAGIEEKEFNKELAKIKKDLEKNDFAVFDETTCMDGFIEKYEFTDKLEKINFFHLTRRLKEKVNDDLETYDLFDVLTKETSLKKFLEKNEINFTIHEQHLDIVFKEKKFA